MTCEPLGGWYSFEGAAAGIGVGSAAPRLCEGGTASIEARWPYSRARVPYRSGMSRHGMPVRYEGVCRRPVAACSKRRTFRLLATGQQQCQSGPLIVCRISTRHRVLIAGRDLLLGADERETWVRTHHCCETMSRHVNVLCDEQVDLFACPDVLIGFGAEFQEYGLIIHDGGTSSFTIDFCPWCGRRFPESQRDRWFDELGRRGIDSGEDEVPAVPGHPPARCLVSGLTNQQPVLADLSARFNVLCSGGQGCLEAGLRGGPVRPHRR